MFRFFPLSWKRSLLPIIFSTGSGPVNTTKAKFFGLRRTSDTESYALKTSIMSASVQLWGSPPTKICQLSGTSARPVGGFFMAGSLPEEEEEGGGLGVWLVVAAVLLAEVGGAEEEEEEVGGWWGGRRERWCCCWGSLWGRAWEPDTV